MKVAKLVLFVMVGVVLLVTQVPAAVLAQTPAPTEELTADTMKQLDQIRAATAKYRDLDTAKAAGYDKFLTCFKMGDDMAMGQHYVNGTLAGDDKVDPMKPEALVYEPQADGSMVLLGFEYLIFDKAWDPNHTGRAAPTLFGQQFQLLTNIPQTPPVWGLHLWLYTFNPEGVFANFNPTVSCGSATDSIDMGKM